MNDLPPLPPLMRDQRKVDADHIKLLAIFHFIGAGLALLGILFLLAHFVFMHALMTNPNFFNNPKFHPNQNPMPNPDVFFAIFKWFYLVMGVWLLGSAIFNVISGCFLCTRTNRTFSLVVAGINCIHLPLGTLLGVFTIVVLSRDSVRQAYESGPI